MKPAAWLLLAPVALVSFGFAAIAQQQPSSAQGWRQSQRTNASPGTPYTRLTLTGKFLKWPQGDVSDRPSLAVDCRPSKVSHRSKGRFLAGNLLVGTTLKIDYIEPEEIHGIGYLQKVSVRYRFDDGKEQREEWSPGADKTSAIFPKNTLKKMLRARTVEITADDAPGSQVVMQFDMPDPATVEEACGLSDRNK